jgi:hypothetical protein
LTAQADRDCGAARPGVAPPQLAHQDLAAFPAFRPGEFAGLGEIAEPAGRSARISTAWSSLGTSPGWPLALLLTIQCALTLRLIWSNTAFSDEALYLWAGRAELAHLLHGTPVPAFGTYFSGSPLLYPPFGAIAAAAGGLAGARLLSLAMMLATTALLHGTTRRLFDRRSAFFAAALFAGLAGTQFLGALATYDAMALLLLALATWLAVLAGRRTGWPALRLTLGAGAALAVANATKYASGLYDPVVICVAVLAVWPSRGRDAAVRVGVVMAAALAALAGVALLAGGRTALAGLVSTTLDRQSGSFSAARLLILSGSWLCVIAALAALGVLAAATAGRGRSFGLLMAVLAAAVAAAPIEQARIHTYTSLFKHDTYGAWFGCIAAGYALAALSRVAPPAKAVAAFRVGVIVAALAALPGIPTAVSQYSWPDTTRLIATAHRVIAAHPGPILADDGGDLLHFYLGGQVAHVPVVGTFYISYRGPAGRHAQHGLAGYADAIRHRYFAVVLLEFVDNLPTDDQIERDVTISRGYRIAASIPDPAARGESFLIWVRKASR